jgi:hypothetical protein
MKTILQKLTGAMFVTVTAFTTGQQQSGTSELRVKDIMAQQSKEAIAASALCRRAWENPHRGIIEKRSIDSKTLFHDLGTMMEKSDEVVLAGRTYSHSWVLSPSGDGVVTYFDVKVMRSWKGSHNIGDTLTFGVPVGAVHCGEAESHRSFFFSSMIGTIEWPRGNEVGPFVLFLQKARDKEAQLVQGLMPTGGEGLQGMLPIRLSPTSEESSRCNGVLPGALEWCDAFLDTSQSPIIVPYAHDPLAKQYEGMPMSQFLNEMRSVAADQGLYEKSTSAR